MSNETVKVNVVVDEKIFRKFYLFECFYRKRGYLSPLIFACIISAFATVCFLLEDGTFLGVILLTVGLALPSYRFYRIFNALKIQIRILDLKNPKEVYILSLSETPNGIEVTNHGEGEEPINYEWNNVYKVYRVNGCIYLYVLQEKAYILPMNQTDKSPDALWQIFTKMLPPEKLCVRSP